MNFGLIAMLLLSLMLTVLLIFGIVVMFKLIGTMLSLCILFIMFLLLVVAMKNALSSAIPFDENDEIRNDNDKED